MGTDFTVVTCQLGLEGCQADKGGGDEAGRVGFALPRLREQHGRRHRGTKSTMALSPLHVTTSCPSL